MATVRFKRSTIRQFMAKHYPGCPPGHRKAIIYSVARRSWTDATIGKAVGIAVSNHVRHRMTLYETWMRDYRLTREEARVAEASTVSDIVRSWREAKSPADVPITRIVTVVRRPGEPGGD